MSGSKKFEMDPDGWVQLSPIGEFPHKVAGVVQVVDEASCAAIAADYKERARSENFPGVLVDFDHFSQDIDKSSEAAGWLVDVAARDDGLWGRVRWSDSGEKAVAGGRFRLVSPVFPGPADCEPLGGDRIRPLSLVSVALTNEPNIRGSKPLTNRAPGPDGFSFACGMLALRGDLADRLRAAAAAIPDEDLAGPGRETDFHVTVLYGLHTDSVEAVSEAVRPCGPVNFELGSSGFFEVPDNGYDVVKIAVTPSASLLAVREALMGVGPFTSSFPTYEPHVTLAYVKPGAGARYVDAVKEFDGEGVTCSVLSFSDKAGAATEIPLDGVIENKWSDAARASARASRKAHGNYAGWTDAARAASLAARRAKEGYGGGSSGGTGADALERSLDERYGAEPASRVYDLPDFDSGSPGQVSIRADARVPTVARSELRSGMPTMRDILGAGPATGNAAVDAATAAIGTLATFGPGAVGSAAAAGRRIPHVGGWGEMPTSSGGTGYGALTRTLGGRVARAERYLAARRTGAALARGSAAFRRWLNGGSSEAIELTHEAKEAVDAAKARFKAARASGDKRGGGAVVAPPRATPPAAVTSSTGDVSRDVLRRDYGDSLAEQMEFSGSSRVLSWLGTLTEYEQVGRAAVNRFNRDLQHGLFAASEVKADRGKQSPEYRAAVEAADSVVYDLTTARRSLERTERDRARLENTIESYRSAVRRLSDARPEDQDLDGLLLEGRARARMTGRDTVAIPEEWVLSDSDGVAIYRPPRPVVDLDYMSSGGKLGARVSGRAATQRIVEAPPRVTTAGYDEASDAAYSALVRYGAESAEYRSAYLAQYAAWIGMGSERHSVATPVQASRITVPRAVDAGGSSYADVPVAAPASVAAEAPASVDARSGLVRTPVVSVSPGATPVVLRRVDSVSAPAAKPASTRVRSVDGEEFDSRRGDALAGPKKVPSSHMAYPASGASLRAAAEQAVREAVEAGRIGSYVPRPVKPSVGRRPVTAEEAALIAAKQEAYLRRYGGLGNRLEVFGLRDRLAEVVASRRRAAG